MDEDDDEDIIVGPNPSVSWARKQVGFISYLPASLFLKFIFLIFVWLSYIERNP